jgi:CspA family cold shock protein
MPPLNSRSIDKYCAGLLDILDDDAKCAAAFEHAGNLILQVESRLAPWREPSHRTRVFSEALIEAIAEDATKQAASVELAEGYVKFFSVTKGFGFIIDEEGGDVFVHQSVLDANGIAALKVGQAVRYAAVPTISGRPRIVEIHLA